MIEPLLEVPIPSDMAIAGKHHRAGAYGENVVILKEAFSDVQAQENLASVCRLFASHANVRLVAVEGADSEVEQAPVRGGIPELIAAAVSVSAGVLFLLQEEPDLIEAQGVDEMGLNVQSRNAMTNLMFGEGLRETAFDRIRPLLEAAQARCYPAGVAELQSSMLRMLGEGMLGGMPLAKRIQMIEKEAAAVGLDTRTFPAISGYLAIRQLEEQINQRRAERQNKEFLERLLARLYGWFKPVAGNKIEIDPAAAMPIVDYWRERTGMSSAEVEESVRVSGWTPVLRELRQWIDTWLVAEAQRHGSHSGAGQRHVFDEELMRLALRLDVDFFDLHDFRDAVGMNREMDKVKATLADEIPDAVRSIVGRLESPEAARLRDLEDRIDTIYLALRLELPPEDAEIADVDASRLISLCEELSRLAGTALTAEARQDLSSLQSVLQDATLFLDFSLKRGRHMASKTIELMRERGEDRAILVAGGFHERTITRQIETERDVSWSVLVPTPGDVAGTTTLPSLVGDKQ
jgi:hypothetical protein